MKVIAFAVVDKDYINPLRVMLKSFRTKNNIPFKIFKIDNFKIPNDLKNIANVEYIDFKPVKTIKWVNDNFDKFNKDSFKNNLYNESKIINMFTHLEIEDILLKEYDVVFKTDIDVVYLDNIESAINNFFDSNKSIGMSIENNHSDIKNPLYESFKNRKLYFNAGFLMINSKKCHSIFNNIKSIIEEYGFEKFTYLDQDAINLYFNEDDFYNLINDGFINAQIPVNLIMPSKISSIHYNHIQKPFAKIDNDRPINIVTIVTILDYLKISKACDCDEYFLDIIKAHADFIKNNYKIIRKQITEGYSYYYYKPMRGLAQKICEKINMLINFIDNET